MAIIYSYPINTNILATDIIVGSSTAIVNGRPKNQTKSFEISDLAAYFASVIAPPGIYVPYNGATGPVNLGAYNLTVNTISVGKGAGTGINNTAIGNSVLISNTTGTYNVAIGFEALKVNTTGSTNIAIGRSTMPFNTTGFGNTALGYNSMFSNTTGGNNVSIGTGVMTGNTTGSGNVAIGYNTLTVQGAVSNTVAIGQGALQFNNSGLLNTAVGYASMAANTSGSNNVALGANALQNNNTGSDNTALGMYVLLNNSGGAGTGNTGVGKESLRANTTGGYNVGVGRFSLYSNTTGEQNTATGASALSNITTGSFNVGVGYNSLLLNPTDNNSIVIGSGAIGAGSNTATLGNTSITTTRLRGAVQGGSFVKDGGTATQYLMADGTVSTAAGITSLNGLITSTQTFATGTTGTNFNINSVGSTHTFNLPDASITVRGVVTIGGQSFSGLKNFTDNIIVNGININKGSNNGTNIAIGAEALDNTIGNQNTVIGFQAASNNDVVSLATSFNTVLGYQAYSNGQANNNTAIGWQSLFSSAANNNSALGYSSGLLITTGFQNTFIGAFAGGFAGQKIDAANSTAIGYQTITTKNNQVVLGNSSVTETVIRGTTLVDGGVFNAVDSLIVGGTTKSTQYKLSALNTAPASATAAGTLGEIRVTAAFIYVCIATNTWVRAALTTW
jgi:hypothetical protein